MDAPLQDLPPATAPNEVQVPEETTPKDAMNEPPTTVPFQTEKPPQFQITVETPSSSLLPPATVSHEDDPMGPSVAEIIATEPANQVKVEVVDKAPAPVVNDQVVDAPSVNGEVEEGLVAENGHKMEPEAAVKETSGLDHEGPLSDSSDLTSSSSEDEESGDEKEDDRDLKKDGTAEEKKEEETAETTDSETSESDSESDANEAGNVADKEDEDDEGEGEAHGPLKTQNEVDLPPAVVVKGTLDNNTAIVEVGAVHEVLDNMVIVQSNGLSNPLDEDSLLCFKDKEILGKVFETFGLVSRPLYSVRFNSAEEIDKVRAVKGAPVMFVPEKAKFVSIGRLKTEKGSDASNRYDEEPAEEEIEFSDDEKEREHKLALKKKKRSRHEAQGEGAPGKNQKKPRLPQQEPVYTPLPVAHPLQRAPKPANPFLTAPPQISSNLLPTRNPLVLPLPQPRQAGGAPSYQPFLPAPSYQQAQLPTQPGQYIPQVQQNSGPPSLQPPQQFYYPPSHQLGYPGAPPAPMPPVNLSPLAMAAATLPYYPQQPAGPHPPYSDQPTQPPW